MADKQEEMILEIRDGQRELTQLVRDTIVPDIATNKSDIRLNKNTLFGNKEKDPHDEGLAGEVKLFKTFRMSKERREQFFMTAGILAFVSIIAEFLFKFFVQGAP